MLVPMSKVEVIGPKAQFYDALGLLHDLGCMHIEDISKKMINGGALFVRQMSLNETAATKKQILQNLLVDVNGILSTFQPGNEKQLSDKIKAQADKDWLLEEDIFLSNVKETVAELKDKTRELTSKRSALQQELANLAKYEAVISKITPIAGRLVALEGFESIALLLEKKFAGLIEVMREELAKMTKDQFHLMATEVDESTLAVLIIFSKNYAKLVRAFVLSENVNEVRLPEELADLSYDKALMRITKRRSEIPQELTEIQSELQRLSAGWFISLAAKKQVLSDRYNEFQMVAEAGQTDYTFIVEGWLPKARLATVFQAVKDKFGSRVVLHEVELSEAEAEEAPIQYIHSRFVKPFEPITRMFGNPRYGSIDPSPFLALFFPLFFGIILGDMGYALVIILGGWWLKRRFSASESLQGLGLILILSGVSSFVFGFIYGEFFGNLPKLLGIVIPVKIFGIWFPWERSESQYLLPTLMFAVALGVAHIILGLVLGIINAARARARKHVIEKASMLGALFSLFLIIGASAAYLPVLAGKGGWTLLVVFFVLLVYSAGIMGPIEILGTVANIVSYARIMAIGLVSVILAQLANKFGGMTGNIFLGIMVAAMVHALNIAIHVFTPSLHVLRLNFVEFYGKFYESGGKAYNPFKRGGEL